MPGAGAALGSGPAPSGSELRWAWEGASSPFVPYPSASFPTPSSPAVGAASCADPARRRTSRGGRDASLQFGAHGRRWESERGALSGGEAHHRGPEPAQASGGVAAAGVVPRSVSLQPGEEEATWSELAPERCAAPRVPSEEAAATGAGRAQGAGVAREAPRAPEEANHAGRSPGRFPAARAPPPTASVPREGCGPGSCGRNGGAGAGLGGAGGWGDVGRSGPWFWKGAHWAPRPG